MEPPAGMSGDARGKWLGTSPTEVEVTGPDGRVQRLTGVELTRWKYQRYMQDYLACVQGVDDGVSQVLDYLDRNDLAKDTIVFYTSDNGFFLGEMGMYDKRFMYEPSLRVPLLVRGYGIQNPGRVPGGIVMNVDLAPTFLDLAGVRIPPDMHGQSLVPWFRGEVPKGWRSSMYYRYYHDPGHHNTRQHYGVRTETHKLVHYWKKDAWELFDLRADPNEQRNLADDPAQAETLRALKAELARLRKELGDEDRFANVLPRDGVDGNFAEHGNLGRQSVAGAVEASVVR